MKTTLARLNRVRPPFRSILLLALFAPLLPPHLHADGPVAPPLLEFASGLPGKQVRLSWVSQTGVRYAVEKSTTLASGGVDGWTQVALVEATGPDAAWLDPVATTTKAFYRVSQPLAEVFSISPPVLSPTGGALVIRGQCIPAGSFLVIQIPGQTPILVPLSLLPDGTLEALVSGTFTAGDEIAVVGVQDGSGTTLLTLNQPLTITATGRALDSPSSLPPGAPVAQSSPIPGVGIVIKRNHGKPGARVVSNIGSSGNDGVEIRKLVASNIGSSGQDGVEVKWRSVASNIGSSGQDGVEVDLGNSFWLGKKGYDYYQAQSQLQSTSLLAIWASRKGYQYYKAQSDLSSTGAHHNPYFQESNTSGNMPDMRKPNKHPDLMKREMGPGAISPASSGLPGEASLQFCALSLDTPAGPPLHLIHTYRSKPPGNGGGGSGGSSTAGLHWERCYDISIKPIPTTAGSNATRLEVCDGGGRCDIFYRQPDGTYRCDGMFREGSFVGDTFTLTFADKGTWTFRSLSDSNAPGQIAAITDRNNVALTCDYDGSGQLERVSSQFGQQLTMTYGADGSLSSASDHSGRSVYYTYYGPGDPDGSPGDLKSISAPQVGSSSPFGPTTFTYLTGEKIPELNGNLRSITDGANRLLEAFTYSAQSDPTAVDFDTCATHDRHRTGSATGGVTGELVTMSFEPLSSGGYAIIENDELGRVVQTNFDRLHRETSVREYTGFATPGAFVTPTSFPLSGKLFDSDPDFFETTCAYNADSLCTRITYPDGSKALTIYDRDFRRDCPVRERGNARVMTLQTAGGEMRTVQNDYLPGFGNPESARPGNPISGLTIKGGKNPGGNINAQSRKGGMVTGSINVTNANRKGWDGSVKGHLARAGGGITAGAIAGIVVAALTGNVDEDCDGKDGDCNDGRKNNHYEDADKDGHFIDSAEVAKPQKPIGTKQKAWLCSNFRTRIVSAHGQVSTFGYDSKGNCTSYVSSLPSRGHLYQYNADGQRTSTTVLNGPGSSFTDTCIYHPTTRFLSSVVSDGSGLALTTACGRDNLGRVIRVIDPRGNEWSYAYNPLDDCTQTEAPELATGAPDGGSYRISTNLTLDAGGRVARCDVEHRAPDGTLDVANPVYSTFYVRDERCRLVQIAEEDRPVNSPPGALAPALTDLASYDVCDITLDNAGQVARLSTPAACREQATDLDCDFTYTERGQLHRCIEGGLGTAGAVTTEHGYDLVGATVRCTTLGITPDSSPQTLVSYDGFHRISSITDPMGNVTEYAYGNDGSVTTSLHGEINDLPGSTANVLLARCVCKSGFMGPDLLALMKAKEKASRTKCANGLRQTGMGTSPFFEVELEDDTFTVERFTPGSTAPPVAEVTTIDRSPAGLVQSITCNGDLLLSCAYDTAGREITCTDGACSVVRVLDACGNPTAVTRTDISGVPGLPSKTFTTSNSYDPLCRVTSCTAGAGNVSSVAYDSLSRPRSIAEPGRPPLLFAYDGGTVDPTGDTRYSVQVSCAISSTGSPQLLSRSLVRSGECRSTTDANGFVDVVSRDALGRATRCDFPDGTFEETTFNSRGLPTLHRSKDGTFAACDFNLNDCPTLITRVGSLSVTPISLGYDGLGRLVRSEQGSSLVTCAFDSCGNPVSEITASGTVTRTFNSRGRASITYPDGKQFNESRNALGQVLAITTSTGGSVVTMGYAGHRVVSSTQGNGVVTNWTYRGDGESGPPGAEDFSFDACVRSVVSSPSSVVLSDQRTFRDRSQQTTRSEDRFAAGATAPYRSKAFTLDGLGRITACVTERREIINGPVIPESSVSYVLGADGRRLSELRNGASGVYTQSDLLPPGDFQMGQYTSWPGSALPLEWDANGNLGIMTKGTSKFEFVHNDAGQLVAVNDTTNVPSTPLLTYAYDALGRRASRTTQGTTSVSTTFVYDGDDCIQELGLDGSGGTINAALTFVASGGLKHCISTRNGTLYYPNGGGGNEGDSFVYPILKADIVRLKEMDVPDVTMDCIRIITNASGDVSERYDCDDACKPIFLTSDGLPSSDTSSSIGLRWLAPACAWEPEIAMIACAGGIYSPDLGTPVSKPKAKPKGNLSADPRFTWDLKTNTAK